MRSVIIRVHTGTGSVVHDLSGACRQFVAEAGDGLLNVFVPHATAGLALVETGAGSDADLLDAVDTLLPRERRWHHRHCTSGHGRDHVLPAFLPPSLTLPVLAGRLRLGTWQSVCLVDTNVDNPDREVRLSFLPG